MSFPLFPVRSSPEDRSSRINKTESNFRSFICQGKSYKVVPR